MITSSLGQFIVTKRNLTNLKELYNNMALSTYFYKIIWQFLVLPTCIWRHNTLASTMYVRLGQALYLSNFCSKGTLSWLLCNQIFLHYKFSAHHWTAAFSTTNFCQSLDSNIFRYKISPTSLLSKFSTLQISHYFL